MEVQKWGGEEFQNAKMDLLKHSAGLCFSRFGCIFKCFDVGRHRLLHVFGRPFLGIVWVGNRHPAPQTPWTARCNFFGYSLQIKQVYDTLAFWCAASVWNYYILWYIGLLVLLGFKKPWLDVKNGISRNHLTISRLAKPVSNGKGVSVCSVCETGGDICWTNQEIVITVYTIY